MWWCRWWVALWCVVCAIWPAGAQAYEVQVDYWVDSAQRHGRADIEQLPAAQWTRAPQNGLSLGYTEAAIWLRVRIVAQATDPGDAVVRIGQHRLETVEIYRSAGLDEAPLVLGVGKPFAERLVQHRAVLVPLSLSPGQTAQWWVRVHGRTAAQVVVDVHEKTRFFEQDQKIVLVHGLYIGMAVAMLIYNTYLYCVGRQRIYFWYVLWIFAISGFSLSMSGMGYQWIWANSPVWNLYSWVVFLAMAVGFGVMFFHDFLKIDEISKKLSRVFMRVACLQVLIPILSVFLTYQKSAQIIIAITVLVIVAALVVCVWVAIRFNKSDYTVLCSFGLIILGGCLMALSRFGWMQSSDFIDYAPQIGSAIEMLMFSVVLAARSQAERDEHERLQTLAIEQQRRWNEELESKVDERTDELRKANQSLARLSRTDALTGLLNRRFLEESIEPLLAHLKAHHLSLAVFMLDIDHFKKLNDTHGHAAGDRCLCEVAQRLREQITAEQQVLVRYGGEEFCALAPVAHGHEAEVLAEQFRVAVACVPIEWENTHLSVSISIGVAIRPVQQRGDVILLQQLADESLYAAKARGRNRWVVHPPN